MEYYLRKVHYMRAQPAPYPCIRGDKVLNHVFRENCVDTAFASNLKTPNDIVVRTNSLGLRMPAISPQSEKIAIIGDSYTEGFGLTNEENFPARIEWELEKRGAKNLQVINGGTLGFSPALYAIYYKAKIAALKPKLVILNLDFTDITDDVFFTEQAEYKNGEPVAFPGRDVFPPQIAGFIYQNHSAFLRFLHSEINAWARHRRAQKAKPEMEAFIRRGPTLISETALKQQGLNNCWKSYELTARYIAQLKSAVEANGALFAIHMYLPGYVVKRYPHVTQSLSFWQKYEQLTRTDYSWACGLDERGVPIFRDLAKHWKVAFFDSTSVTKGRPNLYFDLDAHWNAEGVKTVTGNLAPRVFRLLQSKRKVLNTGNETPRPRL